MYCIKYIFAGFILILPCHIATAQVSGCTDPLASNYNIDAAINDGSCIYPNATVSPVTSLELSDTLLETSGLIFWNGKLWTHNDNTDINLYAIDTLNGNIGSPCALQNATNSDWEEISQDSDYIYVGDFGNNVDGNRTDLHILRIEKNSLCTNPIIDTIYFSYSDQFDFTPAGNNNTDFDCEAFIVTTDSIYLFTKQWISEQTSVYALPKLPGSYTAELKFTYDVEGLITGAAFLEDENLIVLCGYSNLLQPFLYLLYDFNETDFFSGNKRKINVDLPIRQVEGIATRNGLKYFLSNEYFSLAATTQKLHVVELDSYLNNYFGFTTSTSIEQNTKVVVFPVPSDNLINISLSNDLIGSTFTICDRLGRKISGGIIKNNNQIIPVNNLPADIYFLTIINNDLVAIRRIQIQ